MSGEHAEYTSNWVGSQQRREAFLEGDRLTLSTPPMLFQDRQRVLRLIASLWDGLTDSARSGSGLARPNTRWPDSSARSPLRLVSSRSEGTGRRQAH